MQIDVLSDEPRVLLGDGALSRLGHEVDRLGVERVLVVCTPGRLRDAELLEHILGARSVGIFAEAAQHVPATVAERARERSDDHRADAVVAFGGGTAIGVAKAIAATRPVVVVAVPTTYSGSEMTDIYGVTENDEKRTGRSARVRPALVVYDPALTRYLPRSVTVSSGLNAFAHCAEALWVVPEHAAAREAAAQGLALLASALPEVVGNPANGAARAEAMRGAYFAGRALEGGVALHHKLCHLLGGTFGLPHAETHAVLLPHVTAYNDGFAESAAAVLRSVLGSPSAPGGLFDFCLRLGGPTSLASFGFSTEDAQRAANIAVGFDLSSNPRPVDAGALRRLLEDAQRGARPPS